MWIEIMLVYPDVCAVYRHPPHGGCGLKFKSMEIYENGIIVIPHTGDVD